MVFRILRNIGSYFSTKISSMWRFFSSGPSFFKRKSSRVIREKTTETIIMSAPPVVDKSEEPLLPITSIFSTENEDNQLNNDELSNAEILTKEDNMSLHSLYDENLTTEILSTDTDPQLVDYLSLASIAQSIFDAIDNHDTLDSIFTSISKRSEEDKLKLLSLVHAMLTQDTFYDFATKPEYSELLEQCGVFSENNKPVYVMFESYEVYLSSLLASYGLADLTIKVLSSRSIKEDEFKDALEYYYANSDTQGDNSMKEFILKVKEKFEGRFETIIPHYLKLFQSNESNEEQTMGELDREPELLQSTYKHRSLERLVKMKVNISFN